MESAWSISNYNPRKDRAGVLALWKSVFGYTTAHNDPALLLTTKVRFGDDLLFVAQSNQEKVVGTIMAGYDGHRGWLYSLAVSDPWRGRGIGSALVDLAETELFGRGCLKINLQILEENREVEGFYQKLGYVTEPRISMGKTIPSNIPSDEE